ncbi:hypothetical protein KDX01_07495 [Burkholderia vietnamiensis]|uniref:hypothetical protein n=1 Tax=Burkholderia vietnamiensis TaxID=60552 RepID=UPI001B9E3D74|nr:hypothetical protein [Burkholderia vietnamiensis]MBR7972960.1 hypothetical protein [Burkholderia vietnamiensis]
MEDKFLNLKTNRDLLVELAEAASKKQSQAELAEQRVSFVYGVMKVDSGVTREQVRKVIAGNAMVGAPA